MARAPTTTSLSDRLTSKQAAVLIGITDGVLRNWRMEGRGPAWHTLTRRTRRIGRGSRPRVYYLKHEVEAFINFGIRSRGFNGKGAAVRSKA